MQYKRWVYIMNYKDLSDTAKEQAFKRHVEYAQSNDYDWWENTFCDWVTKLEGLGIHTDNNQMFFGGFGSQGDGACFTGAINLKDFLEAHPDVLRQHVDLYMSTVPFDTRGAACEYYDLELTRHGATNYNHENTVHIGEWDVNCAEDKTEYFEFLLHEAEDDIEEQCREYMKEIYRDLEKEHEYRQSMECFLDSVDYKDFDEEGELT
jgi:hypothetical protein